MQSFDVAFRFFGRKLVVKEIVAFFLWFRKLLVWRQVPPVLDFRILCLVPYTEAHWKCHRCEINDAGDPIRFALRLSLSEQETFASFARRQTTVRMLR